MYMLFYKPSKNLPFEYIIYSLYGMFDGFSFIHSSENGRQEKVMKRFFLNRASMRSLLTAFLILFPIMVPFTLLLSHQFSNYSYDEINRFNRDKVIQISENIDYTFSNIITGGLNLYENIEVQNWMNSGSTNVFLNEEARNTLRNYIVSQPFLYSCYLINTRTRMVLNTNGPDGSFETFSDQSLLHYVNEQKNPFLKMFSHTIESKQCLALILPSSPMYKSNDGYLVMFIDKDLLCSLFIKSGNHEGTEMVVRDSGGNIILESNHNRNWNDAGFNGGREAASNGQFYFTRDQEKWTVSYARMETMNWEVYSMNPLSVLSARINLFRNKVILYFALFYFMLILEMFWNFLKTNKLLYKLSEQIRKRMGGKRGTKMSIDYSLLDTGIQNLFQKIDETDMVLREQKDMMREEYLRRWILQGTLEKDVERFLNDESRLLQYRFVYLAVIRLDSYQKFCEENNFSSRQLMEYAIKNITNELITNEGWGAETVDMGSDHLVLLIGRNEEMDAGFLFSVKNVGDQLLKWMQLRTSIACSRQCAVNADNLRQVYDKVLELTMLKFISGEDKVYIEKDYDAFQNAHRPIPDVDILDDIINSVRLGKYEMIRTRLYDLFGQMQNITYESCKLQLVYIYYMVVKSFSQIVPIEQGNCAESLIEKFGTLGEFRDWLCKLLMEISENINAGKISQKKEEIAKEIAKFVNSHIQDPMLNQNEIAVQLSWSYSYIRHTFKEVYGITLADYILQTRINMAKSLLETTDLSVTDVAKRSGFQTKSYYFTVFKKLVGLTPNEYRESIRTEETLCDGRIQV